jgi:hypothetical protein
MTSLYAEHLARLAKPKAWVTEEKLDKNTALVTTPTGHSIRKIGGAKRHYTYEYHDPRPTENCPIYFGKGQGRRSEVHLDEDCCKNPLLRAVIHDIRKAGFEPVVKIVERFHNETEALELEVALIAKHGRRDQGTGTLCNLSVGGEGTGKRKRQRRRYKGVSWHPGLEPVPNTKKPPKRMMLFTEDKIKKLWNAEFLGQCDRGLKKWTGPEWLYDEKEPALILRRGSKWYVQIPGSDRYPLNRSVGDTDIEEARDLARADLVDARKGIDAREERRIQKEQNEFESERRWAEIRAMRARQTAAKRDEQEAKKARRKRMSELGAVMRAEKRAEKAARQSSIQMEQR